MSNNGKPYPAHPRCPIQDQSSLRSTQRQKTLAQLSSEFGIHAQMITDWKRQALDGMSSLFEAGISKQTLSTEQREQIEAPLFQQIGQLKVENDFLKKKLRTS
jgi:transposase-like protein